ncbi:hypothetical protein PAESOLCIP111_02786 [Paenibacillus solanacearum]|uniref:Uncharacterized protein n=1 Tax=Paenibacillus solanacearum TaxID=2048548 RepID=A0A916K411_9BACL|nr:hypothetical protein [Paenibacillus solanacearum]CAG7626006.1 hypothetical protein PAESOLCIP111_02786 [Paenibacillus solanacearum]
MAQSSAKKQRMKLERQGKLNPESNRGLWGGVMPVERMTPTLHEKTRRLEHKHKKKWNRSLHDSDGSISFCVCLPRYYA